MLVVSNNFEIWNHWDATSNSDSKYDGWLDLDSLKSDTIVSFNTNAVQ